MDAPPILLRLPFDVRIRIYRFCGLIRYCPINLSFEPTRLLCIANHFARTVFSPHRNYCRYRSNNFRLISSLECFCPSMPLHLLLVSHAFYNELFPILYGENQFKVTCRGDDMPGHQLNALRALSPKAWSFIKSLHIGLTYIYPLGYFPAPNDNPVDTIDSRTVDGSRVIRKWAALCRDVLSQIPGYRLNFSLSCNVSDIETALRVMEPLERFQPIAELAICLRMNPKEKALKGIARRAALRLLAKEKESETLQISSRSWNDLPKEIRLDILSRTDLVDHYLSSNENGPLRRDGFEIDSGEFVPRLEVCCWSCSSTLSVCNCPSRRAAFSTTCICPAVPGPLLRVSKLLHSESIEIFFSQNRFTLSGDFAVTRRFLLNLPPVVVQHLRIVDLEISFSQLDNMRNPDSQTARDWETLVASVASLLQLPKLWLSIDAGDMRERIFATDDHDAWFYTSYRKFFNPLNQHLRGAGLRRFHVFLSWPPHHEALAEREVMGPGYESSAEGKPSWEQRQPCYPHVDQLRREQEYAFPSGRPRFSLGG